MPYMTEERIKSYLDTNQLHREQMCRSILSLDARYSEVRPRHPRGGPDGGRDIEAIYRKHQAVYGAVGFINQANDSREQKAKITSKFNEDLSSALSAKGDLEVFVFFTNISLTISEKEDLIEQSKKRGIKYCEVFDRERIRIALDAPDGFSIRFQYLNIALSEEEQASFFARWGDDIQSVISTGFRRIESALDRILFLQEATDPLSSLIVSFELDREYNAEEIGHFRAFCYLTLKEPKYNILSILFGSTDKTNRLRTDIEDKREEMPGIKHGISSGQWDYLFLDETSEDEESASADDEKWGPVQWGAAVGRDKVEFLTINYSKGDFIRFEPTFSLRDLDDAMFLPFLNESLARKVKAIHIYSNGYKLQEYGPEDIRIDTSEFDSSIPISFSKEELADKWVRIRHISSTFFMRFYEHTPKRLSIPLEVVNSLDQRHSTKK